MRPVFRRLADHILPPALQVRLAFAYHRWRGDATTFEGDFASWDEASRRASGYASAAILERTRQAALRAKSDPSVFERDSVLLPTPEYSFAVLAALLWVALQDGGRLHVVDFGGSLGSSFFQFRRFLNAVSERRWAVVEQPHYVECGARELAGDGLSFHVSIEEALQELRPDLLLVSSVLQYLPAPYEALERMVQHGFRYIVLDRTALSAEGRDRLAVQRNPASIYAASYPAWFLDERRVTSILGARYRLVYDFPGHDRALLGGARTYHRGYLYERIASS